MTFGILGNAMKPDRKIYEFNKLCIDGKVYSIGDLYEGGKIIHLKARMDCSEPVAVVFDEDNDIINHYEL